MKLKLDLPPWAAEERVAAARARFGLEHAPTRRINVAENGTWRLETPQGRFALRLYRPERWSDDAIEEEHALMRALGPALGVLPPVPGLDGETLQRFDGGRAALFPWAPGRFARKVKPHHIRALGRCFAVMHRRLIHHPPGSHRVRWDRATLLDHARGVLAASWGRHGGEEPCPFLPAVERLHAAWDAVGPLPEALIHADLHLGNCTFHRGEVQPIDFDDAGVAPLAYDLAIVAQSVRRHPALIQLLLDAYNAAGPPAPITPAALALLSAARVVSISAWVFERGDVFTPEATRQIQAEMPGRLAQAMERLAEAADRA